MYLQLEKLLHKAVHVEQLVTRPWSEVLHEVENAPLSPFQNLFQQSNKQTIITLYLQEMIVCGLMAPCSACQHKKITQFVFLLLQYLKIRHTQMYTLLNSCSQNAGQQPPEEASDYFWGTKEDLKGDNLLHYFVLFFCCETPKYMFIYISL